MVDLLMKSLGIVISQEIELSLISTIKAHKVLHLVCGFQRCYYHGHRHFLFMYIHSMDVSELCQKALIERATSLNKKLLKVNSSVDKMHTDWMKLTQSSLFSEDCQEMARLHKCLAESHLNRD